MPFVTGPALAYSLVIGLYEVFVIHRDVDVKTGRFFHTVRAVLFAFLFLFFSMNAVQILDLFPWIPKSLFISSSLILQIIIGLIAAAKIHAASQLSKTTTTVAGAGETWFHSLLVGALIVAMPYVHPIIKPLLPAWLLF